MPRRTKKRAPLKPSVRGKGRASKTPSPRPARPPKRKKAQAKAKPVKRARPPRRPTLKRPARAPAFDEAETQKVRAAEVVEDIEIQLSLDLLPDR
jgi:hypothetical protein